MRLFSQEHIHCCCRTNRQVPPGGISTSGALCSHSSSPSLGEGCAWCLFASLPALLPSFPPITHNRLCAGWEPRAVSTLLTQTVAFLMADLCLLPTALPGKMLKRRTAAAPSTLPALPQAAWQAPPPSLCPQAGGAKLSVPSQGSSSL